MKESVKDNLTRDKKNLHNEIELNSYEVQKVMGRIPPAPQSIQISCKLHCFYNVKAMEFYCNSNAFAMQFACF